MTPQPIGNMNSQRYLYQLYKPILTLMLICGYNLGFNRNAFTKFVIRVYSVFLIVIISYANMTCCPAQEISFIWPLLEYVVYVMIMLFYKSRMPVYFRKLVEIDTFLRINNRHYYKTRTKIYGLIITMFCIRFAFVTGYCLLHSCYTSAIMFGVYEFSMVALDINRIWRFCIFEEIWYRLKLLRMRIRESPEENYYLYVKDNKMLKENKMRFALYLYQRIADLLDLISPELNASLFMGVICSVPKNIINIYRILLVVDDSIPTESLGIMVFQIFQTSIFIFTPCIVVEMYQSEVEKIRLFLMHQLVHEEDLEIRRDIQIFLQYTSIRTFRYKIWRIIPMDLSLPLQLMNICTTYVIVIVNFTKVFD
ncbi:uncharacterized protein LOC135081839 [Ostrinia nubilalis]|uniref:uncharacterized protein LOC135081839 n=1 Tax=Ostrinia nubilalis TaxID=29057 RepID=UPI0030823917